MNERLLCVALSLCSFWLAAGGASRLAAAEPLLHPGDRLALLGGTFVERMQLDPSFEVALQTLRAGDAIIVRNVGWSGDSANGIARALFDEPPAGYERLHRDLEAADPTVVLIAYGFSAAADGPQAAEQFAVDLDRLVEDLQQSDVRPILALPFASPGIRTPGYAMALQQVRDSIQTVAQERDLPLVDLAPLAQDAPFDPLGLHLSQQGYARLGERLAERLAGRSAETTLTDTQRESLAEMIQRKDQLFFHRYRPQNETYLYLFRKHEQGNNAAEIPQFDPLLVETDRRIHRLAEAAVRQ